MEDKWPWIEPSSPVARGAFIVIEGLDRAGKTTQVKRLCDKLYSLGYNVKTLRFPDRTSLVGQTIEKYLQNLTDVNDHTIHLLFSANRWEKAKWIEDTLSAGYTIVCDRYYLSGVAYSMAKNNPSLTLDWAKKSDIGLPRPDAIVYLDLSPQAAEMRAGYGCEKYENRGVQEKVRILYFQLLSTSSTEIPHIQKIDAGQTIEAVEDEIFAAVAGMLRSTLSGFYGKKVNKLLSW